MVLTYSQLMDIGTQAPDFTLPDTVTGDDCSLASLKGKAGTVIMFVCNHCPYVQHIEEKVIQLATEYQAQEIAFIAISANDAETYPQDSPDLMRQRALDHGYPFSYLYDESQEVAKAYHAECTPEFYVFDPALKCAYHGRFDDASPDNNNPVTGNDLRLALDAVLVGKIIENQQPSIGCNIKWKF